MTLPVAAPRAVLDDTFLSRLAMELATTLHSPETVFAQFGIDHDYYYKYIHENQAFITYYKEYWAIWNAGDNATVRVTKKAGVVLEAFLPKLHEILHDDRTPGAAKATFAQWLSKLSGADNVHDIRTEAVAAHLPPMVTINIKPTQVVISGQAPQPAPLDVVPSQVTIGPDPAPVSAEPTPQPVGQNDPPPPMINLPVPPPPVPSRMPGMPSAPLPGAVPLTGAIMGAPAPVQGPEGRPADMDRFTARGFPPAPVANEIETKKW